MTNKRSFSLEPMLWRPEDPSLPEPWRRQVPWSKTFAPWLSFSSSPSVHQSVGQSVGITFIFMSHSFKGAPGSVCTVRGSQELGEKLAPYLPLLTVFHTFVLVHCSRINDVTFSRSIWFCHGQILSSIRSPLQCSRSTWVIPPQRPTNSCWTPQLTLEHKRIHSLRRRFQITTGPLLRHTFEDHYYDAHANYKNEHRSRETCCLQVHI